MVGQDVQHLHAFGLAAVADLVAQHIFVARLVGPIVIFESASTLRLVDAPSGEHLGQFGHVFLGVAAVYP